VTTVGYGDVTLARTFGRIVAAFVMLQGIAFLAILVAAITSTFVANEEREQAEAREEESGEERIDARFDDLAARLDRLEGMIARLIGP
jgi:voltage-gated potassium channel